MINNIYSLKNILSGRFNDIFEYPTDNYAKARVEEIAKAHPEAIKIDEVELYRLAAIDVETGKITSFEEPVRIELDGETNIIAAEEKTAEENM